jgi:hypothetical protein
MRRVQLEGGFCPGFLPYRERRKIMELETKRKKKDFHLGGSARRETTRFGYYMRFMG